MEQFMMVEEVGGGMIQVFIDSELILTIPEEKWIRLKDYIKLLESKQ